MLTGWQEVLVPIFRKAKNYASSMDNRQWVFLSHLRREKINYLLVEPFVSIYHSSQVRVLLTSRHGVIQVCLYLARHYYACSSFRWAVANVEVGFSLSIPIMLKLYLRLLVRRCKIGRASCRERV